jgi:predicted ATPase
MGNKMGSASTKAKVSRDAVFLRTMSLNTTGRGTLDGFPFSVPAIRSLPEIRFTARVTFFVGENGSGKSTLLEGLAAATGLPAIGSERTASDETLGAQRRLASALKLVWNTRTHRGFFLRAEDFFGFAKSLSKMRVDFERRLTEIDQEYAGRSDKARGLAKGPIGASLADMERRYGVSLDANSHGQSFFRLFQSRFVPGGLYLLDEPEAPLSPQSQLGLIAMIKGMLEQNAQFIIATHSPILLAFPEAKILSFDQVPIREVAYEDLEHVSLTRDFLKDPGSFLRRL